MKSSALRNRKNSKQRKKKSNEKSDSMHSRQKFREKETLTTEGADSINFTSFAPMGLSIKNVKSFLFYLQKNRANQIKTIAR
jgi:hypothetical protein